MLMRSAVAQLVESVPPPTHPHIYLENPKVTQAAFSVSARQQNAVNEPWHVISNNVAFWQV